MLFSNTWKYQWAINVHLAVSWDIMESFEEEYGFTWRLDVLSLWEVKTLLFVHKIGFPTKVTEPSCDEYAAVKIGTEQWFFSHLN